MSDAPAADARLRRFLAVFAICTIAALAWWFSYPTLSSPLPDYPREPKHPPTTLPIDHYDEPEWQEYRDSLSNYYRAKRRGSRALLIPIGALALAGAGSAFAASLVVIKTRPSVSWIGMVASVAYLLVASQFELMGFAFRGGW